MAGRTRTFRFRSRCRLRWLAATPASGRVGVVTLREPGSFSVTTDLNQVRVRPDQPPRRAWEASLNQVPDPARTGCVVHLASPSVDDPQFRTVEQMGVDLVEPAAAEPGTLEALAAADMPDPLSALRGVQLGEDAVPARAELLVTEVLVGSGRAERATTVRVGPKHLGRRQVLIATVTNRCERDRDRRPGLVGHRVLRTGRSP